MTSEIRIAIRWSDVDAFGHVNNAVYLNYLEEARDRLIEGLLGEQAAWDFVLVHVDIDFRSELKQADGDVDVVCAVAEIGRSSVTTKEEIRKTDGTLAAVAGSVVVPRDGKSGRSRPLTDAERAVLQAELDGAAQPSS